MKKIRNLTAITTMFLVLAFIGCGGGSSGGDDSNPGPGGESTYNLSGTITTSGGSALEGVILTLSGANSGTATTNASGNYSFTNLVNGSYVVTPSLAGYTFTPTSQPVTIADANATTINFIANDGIYSAAGNWTVNALSRNPNNPCSIILGPSYQAAITIAESNGTVTITYTDYDISVTGTRQGNTLTYSEQPVYLGTEQIGTVDGNLNITSDSTLTGTMTVNGAYQSMTCQATYDLTGTKNTSN